MFVSYWSNFTPPFWTFNYRKIQLHKYSLKTKVYSKHYSSDLLPQPQPCELIFYLNYYKCILGQFSFISLIYYIWYVLVWKNIIKICIIILFLVYWSDNKGSGKKSSRLNNANPCHFSYFYLKILSNFAQCCGSGALLTLLDSEKDWPDRDPGGRRTSEIIELIKVNILHVKIKRSGGEFLFDKVEFFLF